MTFGASAVARCALLLVSCSAVLGGDVLDLTHKFDETTLYWDEDDKFILAPVPPPPAPVHGYPKFKYTANDDGGTVMEAPSRYVVGAWNMDQIPVERFVYNRAAVIDIVAESEADGDYRLTVDDLDAWKLANGEFVYPTIVLVKTGFAQFWPDRDDYFKEEPTPFDPPPGYNYTPTPAPSILRHFPGIEPAAAQALADDPAVVGVGIDTASICGGMSNAVACQAHLKLAEANKFTIENVADMSAMPPAGGRITVLPLRIGGNGSAAPCRVVVDPAPSQTVCPVCPVCPGNSTGRGQSHIVPPA